MARRRTQVLGSERAAKAAETETARMISGGEMPVQETVAEVPVAGTPRGLPRGIAGTEVITDPVTGKERLVYKTGEGQAKVDVEFGKPASVGGSSGGGGGSTSAGGTTTYTASDGTKFTDRDIYLEYEASLRGQRTARQSAYDLLYQQFAGYGLGALVEPLRGLIGENVPASEFSIRLRQTEPYKKRFAANAQRIAKGLRALSEAEYIAKEDAYQDTMRRYGLPETYYTKGDLGRQEGFEQLIAGDVSAAELEDRISTAYDRVINAPSEVKDALKAYYPDITNGDILAYTLDPSKAIETIKRKVTAAEIGAGATQAGLGTTATRAEELARFGVTGEQARTGFQTVAETLPRGSQLAAFYGEAPLTQADVESEVFKTTGATEAKKKRERLVGREIASFAGSAGTTQGSLSRERAGQF